jgi:hypothetical protein
VVVCQIAWSVKVAQVARMRVGDQVFEHGVDVDAAHLGQNAPRLRVIVVAVKFEPLVDLAVDDPIEIGGGLVLLRDRAVGNRDAAGENQCQREPWSHDVEFSDRDAAYAPPPGLDDF